MKARVQAYKLVLKRCGVLRLSDCAAGDTVQARNVAHEYLKDSPFERLIVLFLNNDKQITGLAELATQGNVGTCLVTTSAVVKAALVANAAAIIIAHNHPSGIERPSDEDRVLTSKLREVCDVVGVPLLDHIIVTREGRYYSFHEGSPETLRGVS